MSEQVWHNIGSPCCTSSPADSDTDSETDIYDSLLLKAIRCTSSAELTTTVATKLAGKRTASHHQKADHVSAAESSQVDASKVTSPSVKMDVAKADANEQQQRLDEVTVAINSCTPDDITLLSSTPSTSGYSGRRGRKPLSPEAFARKTLKREAKRQRRLERRQSRPPIRTYWNAVSVDLIERIFRLLSIKERHIASQVCPHWFECFYAPYIWSHFVVDDFTFTKRKFNYYLGYQRQICPFKTQAFLKRFGHTIRSLIILPMSNFYNLFEFMAIMESYALHYEENPLVLLQSFEFTFGCQFSNGETADDQNSAGHIVAAARRGSLAAQGQGHGQGHADDGLIGTGGKILEALQRLLGQLIGLKHLALRNLLLSPFEAQYLLDYVAINCCERLRSLTLVNCTIRPYAFLHTGIFINLETLVISSSHLSDDVLTLLADNIRLRHLYIVQNEYTKPYEPLAAHIWKKFIKSCESRIQLHLALVHTPGCMAGDRTETSREKKLIHQPAPVTSIIYDSAYIPLRSAKILDIIEQYSASLECLAFYQMPKFAITRPYSQRADAELIYLSESCPKLRTLIIRELISTSTLLVLVSYARNLTRLYVRRNALRKRFDTVRHPQWTDAFVEWLKRTSRSYEDTFAEVSQKLGYRWEPLTDQQFKMLRPDGRF